MVSFVSPYLLSHASDGNRSYDKVLHASYPIPRSGVYAVVIAMSFPLLFFTYRCNANTADIALSGEIVAENPYGHLPLPLYSAWKSSSLLFYLYAVGTIVWLILCWEYRNDLMRMHRGIGALYILGTITFLLSSVSLSYANQHGGAPFLLSSLSSLLHSVVRVLFSLLLLLSAKGSLRDPFVISRVDITTVVLARDIPQLTVWSVCALILFLTDAAFQERGYPAFLVFPRIVALSVFVLWINASVQATMSQLWRDQQKQKLRLFSRIRLVFWLFGGSCFTAAACCFICMRRMHPLQLVRWRHL